MNIKTFTIGILLVTLTLSGILIFGNYQKKQSVYTPRVSMEGIEKGQEGYLEYMHMLRKDPATGIVDPNLVSQVRDEVMSLSKKNNKSAIGLNWNQMGPDNVGGRTRAILVDRFVPNRVYAGSVAGGLFVSNDGTQSWSPVSGLEGVAGQNLMISCITQTDDGRIFFGTGSDFEMFGGGYNFSTPYAGNGQSGFIGNGVYEYVPSSGSVLPVLTTGLSLNNDPSDSLITINAIASKGNRLYLGTAFGMILADPDGSGLYPSTISGWTNPITTTGGTPENGRVQDIDLGSDGSMLVCFRGKAYTSDSDAYGTFTYHGKSGTRLCGAVAPSNPNVLYILCSNDSLVNLYMSIDKGADWDTIVPGDSYCIDPFLQDDCDPNGGQGFYDAAIAVDPSNWGHILVGGIQLYEWIYTSGTNPIGGSWLKSANLFESITNPYYVHADKHTIVWPNSNTVYIGCDGGVFRSTDGGTSWYARNLGYNVTTFYDVQTAANGWFMGGSQDNGTQLFTYGAFGSGTPLGTFAVGGGDGFDVAFSGLGGGISYFTSQNGNVMRSNGGTPGSFFNSTLQNIVASGNEPFHTVIENWENFNDTLSVDSIEYTFLDSVGNTTFISGDTIFAGDTILAGTIINYYSLTNSLPLSYVFTSNVILKTPADTIKFVDPIQNKFAFRTSGGVYFTRDAARLNASSNEWYKIAGTPSGVENMEFSPDGNHLFLGTSSGSVIRVSGLSMANTLAGYNAALTVETIAAGLGGGGVVSIAVDPNDGNNLIATVSGYSTADHVYRCTNALTATGSTGNFTAIQGPTSSSTTGYLPKMPVYDAEVDYTDKNRVIIGTEWGVWTTQNAFSAVTGDLVEWTDESGTGMTHVPVFAVEQQHLKSYESSNSGYIYLGTHGRGFYMSTDLNVVSIKENEFDEFGKGEDFITNVNVYPNPVNNFGTIGFSLKNNSDIKVNIYNLTGSLVKTIDLGTKIKGYNKVKFDASSLSVGTYIVSLKSNSETKVAKFIVTR